MQLIWLTGILLFINGIHNDNQLTIYYKNKPIEFVEKTEFSLPIPGTHFPNMTKLEQLTDQLDYKISQDPHNASIDEHGNIISEKVGYRINRHKFKALFINTLFTNEPSNFDIPITTIYPEIDSELLSQINSHRIGHYTTFFNASNKTRSYNISLAIKAINNQVIFPGETFSFNKVVGKRTAKKGYLRAPIIIKGKVYEGIGGGICQVSSTLFNAVDQAGLKIIERYSHSKKVPYVPPGRDATVSWYGPDFIFSNNYNQPILIRANSYEGIVIVKIYSSDFINDKPRRNL